MSTHNTYTPPPAPNPDPTPPRRSSATKPLMIILAVIGGLMLIALVLSTVFSSISMLNRGEATMTANTAGVTDLNIDAKATEFNMVFDDVNEATLTTSGRNADAWDLRRDGNELRVDAPSPWFNWCFFGCNSADNHVTLTLPATLDDGRLNADFELSSGRLTAAGQFNRVDVEVGAGEATVNGSATELRAQVSAGTANLDLADVQDAQFEVAAGQIISELTGSAPNTVTADIAAGQLDLVLPDTPYAVISDVSAGDLDNQLQMRSDASHQITVDVAAGDATLRPGQTATQ